MNRDLSLRGARVRVRGAFPALTIMLILLAGISVWRIWDKGLDNHPADLYAYWYPAHLLWQGQNPYAAWLNGTGVQGMVWHIDAGWVPGSALEIPGLNYTPANTAPVLLLFAPLALVSWSNAIVLWALVNFGLCVVTAGLWVRLMNLPLKSLQFVMTLALVLAFTATREVLEYGQTTLLIMGAMLAALTLARRRPVPAGIFLGIALSKYSLGVFPFLLFIYKRWWTGAAVALATQAVGLGVVSWIGGTAWSDTLEAYRALLFAHTNLPGMHLQGGLFYQNPLLGNLVAGVGSLALLLVLGMVYRSRRWGETASGPLRHVDLLLLSILLCWSLLVVYHRLYDNVVMALPLSYLILQGRTLFANWSARARVVVYVALIMLGALWILPVYSVTGDTVYLAILAGCTLTMLTTLLMVLSKTETVILEAIPQ